MKLFSPITQGPDHFSGIARLVSIARNTYGTP